MCLPPHCAHGSHQLDPVTDVCAVVGIWEGVLQELMDTVCVPAAPIHQCDKDVSHTSRPCQDQPWCRIPNALIHSLQYKTHVQVNFVFMDNFTKERQCSVNTVAFSLLSYGCIYAKKNYSSTGLLVEEICSVITWRICPLSDFGLLLWKMVQSNPDCEPNSLSLFRVRKWVIFSFGFSLNFLASNII